MFAWAISHGILNPKNKEFEKNISINHLNAKQIFKKRQHKVVQILDLKTSAMIFHQFHFSSEWIQAVKVGTVVNFNRWEDWNSKTLRGLEWYSEEEATEYQGKFNRMNPNENAFSSKEALHLVSEP